MANRAGSSFIARGLSQFRTPRPCPLPIRPAHLSTSVTRLQCHYSTETASSPPRKSNAIRRGLILSLIVGGTIYYLATPSSPQATTLNDTTFVPYTITARTALSPCSFVMTVVPDTPNPNPPYLLPSTNRWRHPLWSVEFKQPEVQISRHYTPLPPSSAHSDHDQQTAEADGALRFYIRAVGDGEMSRYLNRLRVGQNVHLRGPHVGFDLVHRLGASKNIVFLAGGTGVVPGMQAARVALDGYEDTKVSLLWAVRQRSEIQSARPQGVGRPWWDFGGKPGEPVELDPALEGPSPVAKELAGMKKQYGDRFSVRVAVDDENTAFNQQHVQKTLAGIGAWDSSSSDPGAGCSLHNQKLHERAPEFESSSPNCRCAPIDGTLPGKNLFIVSGPDGFVTHYAGAKEWRGGQHTQGPVGGVVAQVQRQNPQLARDWLVLKL